MEGGGGFDFSKQRQTLEQKGEKIGVGGARSGENNGQKTKYEFNQVKTLNFEKKVREQKIENRKQNIKPNMP